MGQSVLQNQFVVGLIDRLKAKLVGHRGAFDELLTKARFEEARLCDIESPGGRNKKQSFQQQQKSSGSVGMVLTTNRQLLILRPMTSFRMMWTWLTAIMHVIEPQMSAAKATLGVTPITATR